MGVEEEKYGDGTPPTLILALPSRILLAHFPFVRQSQIPCQSPTDTYIIHNGVSDDL